LFLVLLLVHGSVALAAATPLLSGSADPLTGEDEVYPFSLRYRQQVDEQIGLAQMPASAGLAALFAACGGPGPHEGPPPSGPAGTDLLFALKSLRW
jgi:hypothetical protein